MLLRHQVHCGLEKQHANKRNSLNRPHRKLPCGHRVQTQHPSFHTITASFQLENTSNSIESVDQNRQTASLRVFASCRLSLSTISYIFVLGFLVVGWDLPRPELGIFSFSCDFLYPTLGEKIEKIRTRTPPHHASKLQSPPQHPRE